MKGCFERTARRRRGFLAAKRVECRLASRRQEQGILVVGRGSKRAGKLPVVAAAVVADMVVAASVVEVGFVASDKGRKPVAVELVVELAVELVVVSLPFPSLPSL